MNSVEAQQQFYPLVGQSDFTQSWHDLQDFLLSLTSTTIERKRVSMEYYYQSVKHLCLLGQDHLLFKALSAHFTHYIQTSYNDIHGDDQQCYSQFYDLLVMLTKVSSTASHIFSFLQHSLLIHTPLRNIRGLIINSLHQCINSNVQILEHVSEHLSVLINRWRKSNNQRQDIDAQLRYIVAFIKELGLYDVTTEKQFSLVSFIRQRSITHYQEQSRELSANFTQERFLTEAYRGYENEIILGESLFVGGGFVEQYEKIVLSGETSRFEANYDLLVNAKVDFLPLLFWYFKVQDKYNLFRKLIYNFVHGEGTKIISKEDNSQTIEGLIALNDRVTDYVARYFKNDQIIKHQSDDALEDVILSKVNSLSELFSKYLDTQLTKSLLSIKDEQLIINEIDRALSIFKFFTAKDVFESFFTQRLTKRILLDLSYSYEIEYQVFKKLKLECGDQYIRKAQDIMLDVSNQKQVTDEFLDYAIAQNVTVPIQLQITIMSSNAWTLQSVKMPLSMQPFGGIQELYEKFYSEKNASKKKLEWQLECSNCYVEATFKEDKYKLHVSVIQAIILLLFNEQETLSFQDMIARLPGIAQEEIVRSLIAFCTMKEQESLVLKCNDTKKITLLDTFTVNAKFRNRKKMLRINQLQKRETKEQVEETTSKVLKERQYMIDASIVKYMKRVKSAQLATLIKEVMADLKLPLQQKDIKTQIEYLLQKDYLERDAEQMNLFHYQA